MDDDTMDHQEVNIFTKTLIRLSKIYFAEQQVKDFFSVEKKFIFYLYEIRV